MQLTEYFSDRQIIHHLCKVRITSAKVVSDRQDIARFTGNFPIERPSAVINTLLPPRSNWAAFRPKNRHQIADVNFASLCHATHVLRESQPNLPWVLNLGHFIDDLKERVFSAQRFTFTPPSITWIQKEAAKYRALSTFPLQDNIINSLLARYLRDFCDPAFERSSYAFRSRAQDGKSPTHHDAFEAIHGLKSSAPNRDFYVAECDIRGFYDTVDHQVALDSLDRVVNRMRVIRPNVTLDPRVTEIFRAYLECYSFPRTVLEQAAPRLRAEHFNGKFSWPEEALRKHHADPRSAAIGVPQGGALSCVIANLVLDLADKRVQVMAVPPHGIPGEKYLDNQGSRSEASRDNRGG